jgi:hypothetical protein
MTTYLAVCRILIEMADAIFSTSWRIPQETIAYDNDPQKRWAILKLLDDSYLTSTLTDYNYEANSKQIL